MNLISLCELFIEIYNKPPYCYNYNTEQAMVTIEKWEKNGIIIVYSINNRMVGFIGGYYLNKKTLYLDKIGVKNDYRNMGIGSKLMKKLIKQNISIFLRINDRKLEKFYSKFGFFFTDISRNDGNGIIKERHYLYLH